MLHVKKGIQQQRKQPGKFKSKNDPVCETKIILFFLSIPKTMARVFVALFSLLSCLAMIFSTLLDFHEAALRMSRAEAAMPNFLGPIPDRAGLWRGVAEGEGIPIIKISQKPTKSETPFSYSLMVKFLFFLHTIEMGHAPTRAKHTFFDLQ